MPSAIVVGAGLAGLNCARILQEKDYEVLVLEKSDRIGGRVKTDYVDGFQFDHGFQVINPAYAELKSLKLTASLDLKRLPKGFEIVISKKKYLVGDPRFGVEFFLGDLSPKTGSMKEKLAFLRFIVSKPSDGAFGEAMKSSGSFYNQILKGFLDGVFLADSNQVSSAMAHELLRWFMKGTPGVPARGVAELPRLLAEGLDVRNNCEVNKVDNGHVETNQGSLDADVVVIAADPNSSQHLLNLAPVSMNSSWTWYHCVDSIAVQSGFLKVLHRDPLINSVAISNIAPHYAPNGSTLISSTALHELSDKQATEAVSRAWNLSVSDLRFLQRYEIRDALPFHGPHKSLQSPQRISEKLFVAGDSFAIPAQQGALKSGRTAAELISVDR